MKPLTLDAFNRWMDAYGRASMENDAKASVELFSPNARYYETPFDEPMVGRKAIYQYWLNGAKTLKDKASSYEILSVKDNVGISRWQSRFTDITSGRRFELDCLFVVEFDEDRCSMFREWWHLRATGSNLSTR